MFLHKRLEEALQRLSKDSKMAVINIGIPKPQIPITKKSVGGSEDLKFVRGKYILGEGTFL